jgi:predicted glycosyltransferase
MTAEAAVLGTPAIRFNDFVGELAYLEELEHTFGLTYGIRTNEPDKLIQKTKELVETLELKKIWAVKRENMLNKSIDFAEFMTTLIEK